MGMTNGETVHQWAHQTRQSGHNSGHTIFFRGDIIFSYGDHFPMAKLIGDDSDKVLITSRSYSVTTSHHISMVHRAVSHLPAITVPDVLARSEDEHRDNIESMIATIEENILSAARARKLDNKIWYLDTANKIKIDIETYCKWFDVTPPKALPAIPAIDDDTLTQLKREEAQKARERKQKLIADNAEKLTRWRNGERASFASGLPIALRLIEHDGTQLVETSEGATVDADNIEKLWPLVNAAHNGRNISPDLIPSKVGYYSPVRIDKGGTLVIGCHTIPFKECEHIVELYRSTTS